MKIRFILYANSTPVSTPDYMIFVQTLEELAAVDDVSNGIFYFVSDIYGVYRYDSASIEESNGFSVIAATGLGSGNWKLLDRFRKDYGTVDPHVLLFDPERSALVGGRLNNGLKNSGDLPIPDWDPDLVSQYSLTWGWSQISKGTNLEGSPGADTKGSAQIGYNCANAAPYSSLFGKSNVALGTASFVVGTDNIAGATTRSAAPINIIYHNNWAGPVAHAKIKVVGDKTGEFPANEYALCWFYPVAANGSLTTRNGNSDGIFTVQTGGSSVWNVSDVVTVKWNGGDNGRTLVVTSASYNPTTKIWVIAASGGSGDNLPALDEHIWFATPVGGASRLFMPKIVSSSYDGVLTTIDFDRQFATTMDITRTFWEQKPWVMNVHPRAASLHLGNAVFGSFNRALKEHGFLVGEMNVANANYALMSGRENTILSKADYATVIALRSTASKPYALVTGRDTRSTRYGETVHGGGRLGNYSGQQAGMVLYGGRTSDATPTDLYIDFAEPSPSQRFDFPPSSGAIIEIFIIVRDENGTGSADSAAKQVGFSTKGMLQRTNAAGSYVWMGPETAEQISATVKGNISGNGTTATMTTVGEYGADSGESVTISGSSIPEFNGTHSVTRIDRTHFSFANTTSGSSSAMVKAESGWSVALSASGGLRIQVTGQTGKNLSWLAKVAFTEMRNSV